MCERELWDLQPSLVTCLFSDCLLDYLLYSVFCYYFLLGFFGTYKVLGTLQTTDVKPYKYTSDVVRGESWGFFNVQGLP